MELYKYSGAGNDFVVLDGRHADVSEYRCPRRISQLCSRTGGFRAADGRIGSDGLMILSGSEEYDFRMEFYNPDGSSGMMCGNGGRCIAAFADYLGIRPRDGRTLLFEAPDGLHTAEILSREADSYVVRLKMTDVTEYHMAAGGWFVNTGTRHLVLFVPDVEAVDVETVGREYRWNPIFAPQGVNVNFVSGAQGGRSIRVRTFEKGVEAETLACGTGITASAIASWLQEGENACTPVKYSVQARRDNLSVEFLPDGDSFREVYLTGPALRIAKRG